MKANWKNNGIGGETMPTRGTSLPVLRHQLIPTTIERTANSRHGRNEQIYLSGFDSAQTAGVNISEFCQPLLSHSQGRADAANISAKFAKIAGPFCFSHSILREKFGIDIKGVSRPNLPKVEIGCELGEGYGYRRN
jgi:hypothetical protein